MERVGRYWVIGRLGSGGMAEVLLARDRCGGVDRLVVVKRLLPRLTRRKAIVEMFRDEARILAQLAHPQIAQLYEAGEHEGTCFIAMEYVHGASLAQVLAGPALASDGRGRSAGPLPAAPPLPPILAALVAARVASALHHAHRLVDGNGRPQNVIHRDVSPENICISHEGHVKLVDFGIAKSAGNLSVTACGVRKGKLRYMSPEQVNGDPLDGRSDVFSLGIVLHEALARRPLFLRDEDQTTAAAVLGAPVPPPSASAGESVSEALDRIVLRALERDRDRRFSTARELQRELEVLLQVSRASDLELEEYMRAAFGDAELHRAELLKALHDDEVSEYLRRRVTPSSFEIYVSVGASSPSPEREAATVRELPAVDSSSHARR